MKWNRKSCLLLGWVACSHFAFVQPASAQGTTALSYQGQLMAGGAPANGNFDFTFALYDNAATNTGQISGPVTNLDVAVINGLFTASIDFGAAYSNSAVWLAVSVRSNLCGDFAPLTPLQPLAPAPFALYTLNAGNAAVANSAVSAMVASSIVATNIMGTVPVSALPPVVVTNNQTGVNLGGTFQGMGGALSNLNAAQLLTGLVPTNVLAGFQPPNYSSLGGGRLNAASGLAATISGGTNNIASGALSTLGGGTGNYAYGPGSFVGGGGFDGTLVSGNSAVASAATVAGGEGNFISFGADYAFAGGGAFNSVNGNSGVVAGGLENLADADYSFVGGGQNNTNSSEGGTIAGGASNSILAGLNGAIGGGGGNVVSNDFATVPGGTQNIAGGAGSFAAGQNAQALHQNSFVWSDGSATTASSTNSTVTFRASGGYTFFTDSGNAEVQLGIGATAWAILSDRNAKKNFRDLDGGAILEKLAAMPIQQWNYKWEDDDATPNIGPMAQDFKRAFFPGRDDKSITTLEFDGVELAAIQGLNRKLEDSNRALENRLKQREAELEALQEKAAQVDAMEKRLDDLESLVRSIANRK